MHITIVTIGSRGDVQPYIALGQGLQQQAGHRVRLNTHLDFEALAREHDLEFAPLHGNVRDLMSSEAGVSFTESGANPIKFVREFRGIARTMIVVLLGDCLKACADTDLIVMTGIGFYAAYPVAEKLGKPYLQAYLQPVTPTREFTMSVIKPLQLGGIMNYASYFVGGQMFRVRFATAARLLNVVTLGLAMLSWPYGQDCGLGLALYHAATAMIVVGGLWVVVYTWVQRMPRTHAVAMLVALWGVGLIAAEVLPRVGYAKPLPGRPTAWACPVPPRA